MCEGLGKVIQGSSTKDGMFVSNHNKMGEGGRKVYHGLIETGPKSEMFERGGENAGNRLVKFLSKNEVGESGRKAIHRLVERLPEREVGERRREMCKVRAVERIV